MEVLCKEESEDNLTSADTGKIPPCMGQETECIEFTWKQVIALINNQKNSRCTTSMDNKKQFGTKNRGKRSAF